MRPLAAVLLVWLILGQIAAGQSEPTAEDPRQSVYAVAVELYRNGQRARAAELLGISFRSFRYKLKKFDID